MPDLGQLRTFIAVAEELNFTRAAGRLHLAQQAVSKSVSSLEAQLGVTLLERTSHRVSLTPAGQALLKSGHDALNRAEAAFEEARLVGQARAGSAPIGLTPAVGTRVRATVVDALTQGAPDLAVVFRELRPSEAEQTLQRREVEVVISRTPPISEALSCADLEPTPAKLVVAEGHRLAREQTVAVSGLEGERLQMWNPLGHPYTDEVVALLARHDVHVEVVLARVIGGGGPPTLEDDEIALLPEGWPTAPGTIGIGVRPAVRLPLRVLWRRGSTSELAGRIRQAMAADS